MGLLDGIASHKFLRIIIIIKIDHLLIFFMDGDELHSSLIVYFPHFRTLMDDHVITPRATDIT